MKKPKQHHAHATLPDLAGKIGRWRAYCKFSQSELEARAGLGHNTISRIETGQVKPRLETLEKIATAMSLSTEELQFRDPPEPAPLTTEDLQLARLIARLEQMDNAQREAVLTALHTLLDQMAP